MSYPLKVLQSSLDLNKSLYDIKQSKLDLSKEDRKDSIQELIDIKVKINELNDAILILSSRDK
jgi:hypothetical protein